MSTARDVAALKALGQKLMPEYLSVTTGIYVITSGEHALLILVMGQPEVMLTPL